MRNIAAFFVLLSAVACSSVQQQAISVDSVTRMRAESAVAPVTDAGYGADDRSAPLASDLTLVAPRRADDGGLGKPYTKLRVGWFNPLGDIDSLDDGYWVDLTFGRKFLAFLAIEGSAGYLEAGVPFGDEKLWGIPLFVNARASLPILILEPYLGVGVGGLYTEYPGNTDWVWAWDAMAGVGVGLGELQLGLDYRYLKTDDTSDGFAIEGQSVSVFASLPF